jgi:hypothetical protein
VAGPVYTSGVDRYPHVQRFAGFFHLRRSNCRDLVSRLQKKKKKPQTIPTTQAAECQP